MSDPKSDCSILRWLAPTFAAKVEESCDNHDKRYKRREGSRLVADLQWVAEAASMSGQPGLAMFFGAFVMLGGWWLWYDFDEKVRFWR